ncbi:MAG: hypothetical protein GY928_30815 [Colwellia sp.]|nr:hypothetical protein [Colwellia sp.]
MFKKGLSNAFNYSGSKYRYLDDLFEILPQEKNLSVCDMFGGGGDLSTHLPEEWDVDFYETSKPLIKMHEAIWNRNLDVVDVEEVITKAKLSKDGKGCVTNYNNFKAVYNWSPDPVKLYTLICHSNTNRMRFNKSGEFNLPFGKRTFNDSMKAKLQDYCSRLRDKHPSFWFINRSSLSDHMKVGNYDLLLVDPPYLNTTACYNEQGGWGVAEEEALHAKLLDAHEKGVKFVYFNQTISNGVENTYFTEFAKQFNMKVLKTTTETCSNNRKKKGVTTEVMIWNY